MLIGGIFIKIANFFLLERKKLYISAYIKNSPFNLIPYFKLIWILLSTSEEIYKY